MGQRLDLSQVVDPAGRDHDDDAGRVCFGATVNVVSGRGEQRTVSIVGVDEIDTTRGYISWVSPMARAFSSRLWVALKPMGPFEPM